jgi:hypothetical protein
VTEEPTRLDELVLYREPGAKWSALVWGPLFAVAGFLTELVTGGVLHVLGWILVGLGLLAMTAPWIYARRRFLSVRVTRENLWQGREAVAVDTIVAVADVSPALGAKVLGGGWTVPRKFDELPIQLADGSVVLAWARDVEALQAALARVVRAQPDES